MLGNENLSRDVDSDKASSGACALVGGRNPKSTVSDGGVALAGTGAGAGALHAVAGGANAAVDPAVGAGSSSEDDASSALKTRRSEKRCAPSATSLGRTLIVPRFPLSSGPGHAAGYRAPRVGARAHKRAR